MVCGRVCLRGRRGRQTSEVALPTRPRLLSFSVSHVPSSATTATCVLNGDRDPHSRGHPASEEGGGDRGHAGGRAQREGGEEIKTALGGRGDRSSRAQEYGEETIECSRSGHRSSPSLFPYTDAKGHQEGESAASEEVRAAPGRVHHEGPGGTQTGGRVLNCQPRGSLTPSPSLHRATAHAARGRRPRPSPSAPH